MGQIVTYIITSRISFITGHRIYFFLFLTLSSLDTQPETQAAYSLRQTLKPTTSAYRFGRRDQIQNICHSIPQSGRLEDYPEEKKGSKKPSSVTIDQILLKVVGSGY